MNKDFWIITVANPYCDLLPEIMKEIKKGGEDGL